MMRNICLIVSLLLHLPPPCLQLSGLRRRAFSYHRDGKTWTEAQRHCRERHTDLVTIRSEKDSPDFKDGCSWIGLYREDGGPWKWSRGDEKANFTIWDTDSTSNGNCACMHKDTEKWRKDDCHNKHSFMCYNETLVLVKQSKTWEEALIHCRSLGVEGNHEYDLASLTTSDDDYYAREMAQHTTIDEVWTGLRYLAGYWVWVGGEKVQLMNLNSCPGIRACGVLKSSDEFFEIRDCSMRRNFFCYRKPQTSDGT